MKTEICDKFGITMKSAFVPWSQSRNKKVGPRVADYSLNWIVTVLVDGNPVLSTDYMTGIGHCKTKLVNERMAYMGGYCIADADAIIKECETGKYKTNHGWIKNEPDPDDVMYCLVMDTDVINYSCFEDWADSCGYDTDSRSAEKIYHQCLEIALRLRGQLGDKTLTDLQEAFQDY